MLAEFEANSVADIALLSNWGLQRRTMNWLWLNPSWFGKACSSVRRSRSSASPEMVRLKPIVRVVGDILALSTPPFRSEIALQRFPQA